MSGHLEREQTIEPVAVQLPVVRVGRDRVAVTDPWGSGTAHVVKRDGSGALVCDCADFRYRRRACKHIAAVRETRRRQREQLARRMRGRA